MNNEITFRVGTEVWVPDFMNYTIRRGILEWTDNINYVVRIDFDFRIMEQHINMVSAHRLGEEGHTKFTFSRGYLQAV